MKKWMFAVVLFLAAGMSLSAQDIITKLDGTDIKAKITEVNPDNLKYKRWDYQDGPTFTIMISEVLIVRYSNGTNEVFNRPAAQPATQPAATQAARPAAQQTKAAPATQAAAPAKGVSTVPLTMDSIDPDDDVVVLSGSASALKQKRRVYLDLDFSACTVEGQPFDTYLNSRGDDFVNDWPSDLEQIRDEFMDAFEKRCKPASPIEEIGGADCVLTVHVLQLDPGYYNPMTMGKAGGAALWGIAELTDAQSGQPELVFSINEVKSYKAFSETVRISAAFAELAKLMGKMR